MDGKPLMQSNNARRQRLDDNLQSIGADPTSGLYKTGKIVTEIAGTAGLPAAAARPLTGIAPKLASAIGSGGFFGRIRNAEIATPQF